jgi:hypothetical protein
MRKTLFMETTEISPIRTVSEIQELLAQYGASAILTEYQDKEVSAVSFRYNDGTEEVPYRLPCEWRAIRELLIGPRKTKRGRPYRKGLDYEAKKIAWRQTRRWVEAQLAYLQAKQVKFDQAFLAYRLINPDQTLYERLVEMKFKLIEHKK